MGKTADLTAVQKAIIDTLKREGKTQKEISERIGCSQSAVSRHLSGKSVGRKKCGKKRCTTRRGDRTLRKIVEKDRFQTLGDLRKQWTKSGVETSRATVHRRVLLNQKQWQKRLTWATEKQHWTVAQWSKVLFSDESKFCMSFGNQGARVWRRTGEKEMPKCLKSSVKYPQSVMVWGAMSAAGVGPLCFIKALDVSTPDSVHCFRRSPKVWNRSFSTIFLRVRSPLLVVQHFLPHFFLPTDFPLRCLDTALWEQPIRSEISFCVLPSRLRVSMMAFWTAVRSAVLPMIAVLSNEPGWEFLKASGIFCRCLQLIS
uniref:HTH cro/C1-type domain-containing protein n=1 Tax=Cyprinus carpio carpio TaxID=630221 RepID=A0A9J8BQM3_CYPCA